METPETATASVETESHAQAAVIPSKVNGVNGAARNATPLGLENGVDFNVLKQVPMTVQVEIGRTVMTLGEVLDELDVGASIRLDRHAGDPVEVYVNGALFARAEVVLVQDQIGARIIELLGAEKSGRPSGLR